MTRFLFSLLLLAGCSAQVEPVERIPGECYQQTAKAFVSGTATCGDPYTAATCAFDAHNDPTPLDSSGNPLAYYCTCGETGVYTCWRVEWFVEPDPL